ncbi:MAG: glycosyltransferase, partial [Rhodospirillaceae bacterium]|nr:glycosyltransferase [Rhodospirillaceae bacterium]
MSTPRLSAVVVARNEEEHLEACLSAIAFCDEIVVVLDRCSDRSAEIAGRHATQVIEGAWELEGPRRNTGLEAVTGDWI